jgi:hypothetical protein
MTMTCRSAAFVCFALALTACNNLSSPGTLEVKSELQLNGKKGEIQLAAGQYQAKLNLKEQSYDYKTDKFSQEVEFELIGKKEKRKVSFISPKVINTDSNVSEVIPAGKSGQPYDLAYEMKYSFKETKSKIKWESCTWASEKCHRTDEETGEREEYECGISGDEQVEYTTGIETRVIRASVRNEGTEADLALFAADVSNERTFRNKFGCCSYRGKCSPF